MAPQEKVSNDPESLDLILIGAGISGINCGYRLQTQLPRVRYAIFEGRDDIGGTWDLFKYPGIRSDSDLHTFGFSWHPWPHPTPIAEGPLIKSYMKECTSTYGIDKHIRFRHNVLSADWSSKTRKWTVVVDNDGQTKHYKANFVILGAGYFDYNQPRKFDIPGIEDFKGKIIHPQFWPEDYDYSGKKMVIIGSGATAVTLLPNLAKKAAHVTMLQRSPTYIVASENGATGILSRIWPRSWLAAFNRAWFMTVPHLVTVMCRWFPNYMRSVIRKGAVKLLPPRVSVDHHFKPTYNPWEQRLCLAPDGDFYRALHSPNAEVVTARIDKVTESGIVLDNKQTLEADVVVTATGLRMQFGGGIPLRVDGQDISIKDKTLWNGAMIQDVPNLMYMIGYTNASWTLGSDETAFILCRLLKFMQSKGVTMATPRTPREVTIPKVSSWQLSSTYVKEAETRLPKAGNKGPWRPRNSLLNDFVHSRWGNVTDGLHFLA